MTPEPRRKQLGDRQRRGTRTLSDSHSRTVASSGNEENAHAGEERGFSLDENSRETLILRSMDFLTDPKV